MKKKLTFFIIEIDFKMIRIQKTGLQINIINCLRR